MNSYLSSLISRLLVDRRGGYRRSVLRQFRELQRFDLLSREPIDTHVAQRLSDILNHARDNSPFYRERIPCNINPENALAALSTIPVLTKQDIQQHAQDMLVPGVTCSKDATGGSTGEPTVFYTDVARKQAGEAATYWSNSLAGFEYGDRVAMLWGAARDRELLPNAGIKKNAGMLECWNAGMKENAGMLECWNAGMKENAGMLELGNAGNQEPRTRNLQPATCNLQPLKDARFTAPRVLLTQKKRMARNWIENVRWFDAFNMSENRMRDFHKQMTRFAPHLLVAYAGSLHEYAKFLKNNHLKPEYPIKNVISSAEVLTSAIRKLVSEVFQKAIFDRYGNREFGPIAAECEAHDGLHINEHDMLLEIDSDDPYHIPGDIIVTYFSNRGMPFVRYNTGDRGTFAKGECACGRKTKRLQTIEGRLSDSIRTKDGKVIHGEYFTHLMYGVEGVKAFQFVQTTEREFVLRVSFNSPQNAQTRAKVSADQEGPQNTQNMQKGENAGMKENAGMLGLGNAGNQEPRTRNPQPATCNLQPPSWWQDVRAQILEMVGADADVRLEIVDEIPLLPSGKRKFTVSLVGQKNLNRT